MGDTGIVERALIAACVEGDSDAWDALRGRYHRGLQGALRDAGARDEIDDLEQEVWARLLTRDRAALRDFRGGSLRAFLARVALSVCIDHARARRVRGSGAAIETPSALPCLVPNAEHRLAASQQRSRFAVALAAAAEGCENPARDRDILRLHFEEELSPAEIAALGVGLETRGVESVLRRAAVRVRELLRDREP